MTGSDNPVIVGKAVDAPELVGVGGTVTRSEKHTPSPGTTPVLLVQLAATQAPLFKTLFESEHARHKLAPLPEQLEQLESQD